MFVLGFSFGYHDSSVSVIDVSAQPIILGVYAEERFTRKKHDSSFPRHALSFALNSHQINNDNIALACYYENPLKKLSRIFSQFDDSDDFFDYLIYKVRQHDLINPLDLICRELHIQPSKVTYTDHHISHFLNSLTLSSFNDSNPPLEGISGITIDGVGESDTVCIHSFVNPSSLRPYKKSLTSYPDSIGLFYSAITSYLGFEVNDAEYKVMGLASYGKPIYLEQFKKLVKLTDDGFKLDMDYFDFSADSPFPYSHKFIDLFGPPAPISSTYAEDFTTIENVSANSDLYRYASIASSAQELITLITSNLFHNFSSHDQVFYSGGVALNTKCNQTLIADHHLLISPDPADGGSSLGTAVAGCLHLKKNLPLFSTPYLGFDLSLENTEHILSDIENISFDYFQLDAMLQSAVFDLSANKVIGWAFDRAEFGPRALGNRSILANPSTKDAQLFVNKAVKFREPFRPFAPVVLAEHFYDLFDVNNDVLYKNSPVYFMLSTFKAKPKAIELIPACIHVDGTSRVQVIHDQLNPLLHSLITRFYELTGVPALLNTSFNLRGYPIVNNTLDAVSTFKNSGMHSLYVNYYRVSHL